jgi:DNA polymerase-1
MQKTIAVIDTFGFFFRSYFAMPPLKSKSGFPTGLLTGFLNFLSKISKEHEADYMVFCLESKTKGFREDIYSDYKGNRPDAPEDFKAQLPIAIEWLHKLGLATMSVDSFEADDIIASICRIAQKDGLKTRIVSHDKDLYQLIRDGQIVVWDPSKKNIVDEDGCVAKFGVHPSLFIDFQALIGDSVDNVPGVKGIGPKTAEKLINEYKTIENLYEHLDEIKGRTKELLEVGKENAFMSKKLVTLRADILDSIDYDACALPASIDFSKIKDEMLSLDIRHLLQKESLLETTRPTGQTEAKKEQHSNAFGSVLIKNDDELARIVDKIPNDAILAFDTETDSLDTKEANLVGFSFSWSEKEGFYAPIAHSYLGAPEQISKKAAKEAIIKMFGKKIVGHNLKFDIAVVERFLGFDGLKAHADTMLLSWLDNPESPVGLDAMVDKLFSHKMIKYKETVKSGEDFSKVPVENAALYAAEDAVFTLKLYNALYRKLASNEKAIYKEFEEIEMPFMRVLLDMEKEGITVDRAKLKELQAKNEAEIEAVKNEIFELTGFEFNINSTKQLSDILYERLGLKPQKKTKTGLSTDERTLLKMTDEHPVIEKILLYRELFKLKSTYIEPMLELSAKNESHKIYTSFLQTGTATGRLSSKNPNLQNIPTKTESGRQIRYAFVPMPGNMLIGIDYSQIELRLLAHFSQDETLVGAFLEGRDIHLETAQKIFGEAAAKENRNKAKTINFGLLYGMGSQKLADSLSISAKEAKELIESYFASFPTVKAFLESIKEYAKEHGFVETMMGRKRFFDFKNAGPRDEAMYLREAVNTVFQGSAADIIKVAMIRIKETIEKEGLNAKMILQIHDELIFEAKESETKELGTRFAQIMENVVKLNVPIKSSINYGKSWGELK